MSTTHLFKSFADFDPLAVGFGEAQATKRGSTFVPLLLGGSRATFQIATPPLTVPFGLSSFRESDDAEIQSYSLDLSPRDPDDPRQTVMLAKLDALGASLLDTACKKAKAWFGKANSRDVITAFFKPLVKRDETGRYAPIVKTKVQMRNGAPACHVFDEHQQPTSLDSIVPGTRVRVLMEADRVYFIGKTGFGVSWRAVQVRIVSRPANLDTCVLGSDDEGEGPTAPPATTVKAEPKAEPMDADADAGAGAGAGAAPGVEYGADFDPLS